MYLNFLLLPAKVSRSGKCKNGSERNSTRFWGGGYFSLAHTPDSVKNTGLIFSGIMKHILLCTKNSNLHFGIINQSRQLGKFHPCSVSIYTDPPRSSNREPEIGKRNLKETKFLEIMQIIHFKMFLGLFLWRLQNFMAIPFIVLELRHFKDDYVGQRGGPK